MEAGKQSQPILCFPLPPTCLRKEARTSLSTAWTFNQTRVTCPFTPLRVQSHSGWVMSHLWNFSSRARFLRNSRELKWKDKGARAIFSLDFSANCHITAEVIPKLWKRWTSAASVKQMSNRVGTSTWAGQGAFFCLLWCLVPPTSVNVLQPVFS